MKSDERKESRILILLGIVPVVWFALLTAPFFFDGLLRVMEKLPEAMQHPFRIQMCKDSLKTVLFSLLAMEWESELFITREITGEGRNMVRAQWGKCTRDQQKYSDRNLRRIS